MPRRTIKTEETIVDPDNSPTVVAYRTGQLEKAVSEGFKAVHEKLDLLRDGFVSHEELAESVKQGELVHANHDRRIRKLEGWNSWVVKIVLLAVILAILGLILGQQVVRIHP